MILPWGEGGACDTGRIPGGHGEAFGAGTSKTAPFRMDVDGEEVKKCALRPPWIGTRAKTASWCHPISDAECVPLALFVRKGRTEPVSRPAAGAVLGGSFPCGPLNQGAALCRGVFRLLMRRHCGGWWYPTSKSEKSQGNRGKK